MDLRDDGTRDRWRGRLGELFAQRKVICGVAPLGAMTSLVALLARSGARKPMVVHCGQGAGAVPTEDDVHLVRVDLPGYPTMTEELRDHDRVLRALPPPVRRALDDYDPAHEAVWCVGPFTDPEPVDGRTVVGGRPPAWAALEDKIVADGLWDAVGFPRSERRVVEVSSPDDLEAASRDLDRGSGVVWVADARDGFNGGGEFTRWVVTGRPLWTSSSRAATACA
jgi:hypothetical protein